MNGHAPFIQFVQSDANSRALVSKYIAGLVLLMVGFGNGVGEGGQPQHNCLRRMKTAALITCSRRVLFAWGATLRQAAGGARGESACGSIWDGHSSPLIAGATSGPNFKVDGRDWRDLLRRGGEVKNRGGTARARSSDRVLTSWRYHLC